MALDIKTRKTPNQLCPWNTFFYFQIQMLTKWVFKSYYKEMGANAFVFKLSKENCKYDV